MSDAIPVAIGATIGAVGSLAFIVFGRGASGDAQAQAGSLARKRIAARLAFIYLAAAAIWGSIAVIAEASAATVATAGIVLVIAMAVATVARRIRNAEEASTGAISHEP